MNRIQYRLTISIIVILYLTSCVDGFIFEKKIIKEYYLISVDTKLDLSIYRKTKQGDFTGRIPANIIEYGFSDSLILAKSASLQGNLYYIINMNKDFDLAPEKEYLIGPLDEEEFTNNWEKKLRIQLNVVKFQ